MTVYNPTNLKHLQIQDEAEKAFDSGLLDQTELQGIKQKYPHPFYSLHIWARIGVFILTWVIVSAASGVLSLIFMDAHVIDSPYWAFFLAALSYAALELITGRSNHYRSGVDDALTLISCGTFLAALCWLVFDRLQLGDTNNFLFISAVMFICCLLLTLRFTDMLMAAGTSASLLCFIFFCTYKAGPTGQLLLPFVMIISSALLYFWADRTYKKLKAWYYGNALIVVQVLSLTCLYLSGNYFVVRSLNQILNDATNAPLPFAGFFWAWTVVLPLIYIGFGLKRKDVIMLRCGLLLVAAAAFTIRTYFHLMSMESLLCLIGAVLITIAYAVIRYLKTPKQGFTYEETAEKHLMDHMRVESLIVTETFSDTGTAPAEGSKFGGGDFGGGGASGSF